jgi:probable HAF family extracellular repeat protein
MSKYALLALTVICAVATRSSAAAEYSVTNLGVAPGSSVTAANDLNDAGIAAGFTFYPSSGTTPYRTNAFTWEQGALTELPTLPGYRSSEAGEINASGQVVGRASLVNVDNPGNRTVRWDASVPIDVAPSHDTGRLAFETAINDRGDVAGTYDAGGGNDQRAFAVWNGTFIPLGTLGLASQATSMNAQRVVGTSWSLTDNNWRPFVWSEAGGMTELNTGSDDFATASAINRVGQIVGRRTGDGYLWTNGVMTDIETFGGPTSSPADVNDLGVVVGAADTTQSSPGGIFQTRAFVYDSVNGLRDLNTLIDPALGLVLREAPAINNLGQIVATTNNRSYLLTPVPEPGACAVMGFLLLLVTQRRRRDAACGADRVNREVVCHGSR